MTTLAPRMARVKPAIAAGPGTALVSHGVGVEKDRALSRRVDG